jgi:hypothetical protein
MKILKSESYGLGKRVPLRIAIMAITAGLAATSSYAQTDYNNITLDDLSRQSGTNGSPPSPPRLSQQQIESDSINVVLDSNAELGAELSKAEIDLIMRKRKTLIKYLYEEEKLKAVREELAEKKRDEHLKNTRSEEYPLSPDEIKELRLLRLEISQANNAPAYGQVQTNIRTVDLNIESSEPISLDVSRGFASSMVFYDETGRPWPIQGDIIGDQSAFTSKIVGEDKHIAVFEIAREFAESNALINLKGLSVPLVLRLIGREGTVDSRLSVRIPKLGPNAESGPVSMPAGVENAPDELLQMLNGGRLPVGVEYDLIGATGTVYYYEGALYIRTKHELMSPPINPPLSMELQSPTGYNVYKIPPVSQLLFSDHGQLLKSTVKPKQKIELQKKPSIFPRYEERNNEQ